MFSSLSKHLFSKSFSLHSARLKKTQHLEIRTGTVIKSTGSNYRVHLDDGSVSDCKIKGKFRLNGIRTTNPISVGDRVDFETDDKGTNVIKNIHDRTNYIIRKASNLSKESHIIAANMDQLLLVATLVEPETSTGFIDRILLTAEAYHIPSTIIFNKVDRLSEEQHKQLDALVEMYSDIGYDCHTLSFLTAEKTVLENFLKDKVTLLSGHSGVGKSTFVNRIQPNLELRTAEVSDLYRKGKHTTTFAEMHMLDIGGAIIDTPGIKGFGVVDIEKEELSHYFLEMRALLSQCKFNNCQHINEPKCAVLDALEQGKISASRYQSYFNIHEDDEGPYRKDIYG
jgi:ribosome biogenesis GTPase